MSKIGINTIRWIDELPRGAAVEIHRRLRKKVTVRQIQRVLSGESKDLHGIKELALKIYKEELRKREKVEREFKSLTRLNTKSK